VAPLHRPHSDWVHVPIRRQWRDFLVTKIFARLQNLHFDSEKTSQGKCVGIQTPVPNFIVQFPTLLFLYNFEPEPSTLTTVTLSARFLGLFTP
jgi:hypothetical protein